MIRELTRALDRLQVRVMNSIARAVVQRVNDAKRIQILQIGVLEGEDIDDAEHVQSYGFCSVPLAGAEAVVLFPGGDRAHALVVAVDDRRHRPTGGEPGEVVVYNNAGAVVRLKANGDIEVGSAGGMFEPLVKRSEFNAHTHSLGALTAGGDPVATSEAGDAITTQTPAAVTGTTKLKAE